MAHKVHLTPRLTRKYVDQWGHLDKWDYKNSFVAKELGMEVIALPEDFDEGQTVKFGVAVPKHIDPNLALQALYDRYNQSGCYHEWDCCGCPSYHAKIRPVKKGFFSVIVRTSYNY
mgnify:CR=1 FL=1